MDDDDYQKAVSLVDTIDTSHGPESAQIDMSDVFANRLQLKKLSYADVGQLIERGEKGTAYKPEAAQAPQPAQQAHAQPAPQRPQPQPQPQPAPRVPKHELSKDMNGAAERLRSMVGGAGKEFATDVSTKIEEAKEANLVLPKLSLQDQISDLDKMKEGIDEHVFDAEQLHIIEEEVDGMERISTRESKSTLNDEQRELVIMRNQRLKELKGRLNIG